jgi:hypothetical protein
MGRDCRCRTADKSAEIFVVDLATATVEIEDLFETVGETDKDDDGDGDGDGASNGDGDGDSGVTTELGEEETEAAITAKVLQRLLSVYEESEETDGDFVNEGHSDALNNAEAYPSTLYRMTAK